VTQGDSSPHKPNRGIENTEIPDGTSDNLEFISLHDGVARDRLCEQGEEGEAKANDASRHLLELQALTAPGPLSKRKLSPGAPSAPNAKRRIITRNTDEPRFASCW
jgi:hypothetical protein